MHTYHILFAIAGCLFALINVALLRSMRKLKPGIRYMISIPFAFACSVGGLFCVVWWIRECRGPEQFSPAMILSYSLSYLLLTAKLRGKTGVAKDV